MSWGFTNQDLHKMRRENENMTKKEINNVKLNII